MKSNAIVCRACNKVTEDPEVDDVPVIRCEHCNSIEVVWREKRVVVSPGLGHDLTYGPKAARMKV